MPFLSIMGSTDRLSNAGAPLHGPLLLQREWQGGGTSLHRLLSWLPVAGGWGRPLCLVWAWKGGCELSNCWGTLQGRHRGLDRVGGWILAACRSSQVTGMAASISENWARHISCWALNEVAVEPSSRQSMGRGLGPGGFAPFLRPNLVRSL